MSSLQTRGLRFGYRSADILKNINLSVPKGSIYGFLGKNGAGKSTLIKLLLGLESPRQGNIFFDGKRIQDNKLEYYAATGSLIEAPSVYEHLTAFDNLRYLDFIFNLGDARIREVLQMVKLTDHEGKTVKRFSMGMKQRLGIAMAIFSDPSLLILDEPFNGLDPEGVYEMRELMLNLHKKGKTIFFSSHILSDVQKISTHIGFINGGEIPFQGPISDLLSSVARLAIIRTSDNEMAKQVFINNGLSARKASVNATSVNVNNDEMFNHIISLLVKADIKIYSIHNTEPNLEDIFLKFTTTEKYA